MEVDSCAPAQRSPVEQEEETVCRLVKSEYFDELTCSTGLVELNDDEEIDTESTTNEVYERRSQKFSSDSSDEEVIRKYPRRGYRPEDDPPYRPRKPYRTARSIIDPGDVFKCVTCRQLFISQATLENHLAQAKRCSGSINSAGNQMNGRAGLNETPHTLEHPHICNNCKAQFNTSLALGLHLKRSLKCMIENPEVDVPGVVDRNAGVLQNSSGSVLKGINGEERDLSQDRVFVCSKCWSSFSSVWGLRTHERNSTACKPDRPYEIPVPVLKEVADQLKKEFREKGLNGTSMPSPSGRAPLMVYTHESVDEDGRHTCQNCSARFTSVWGLRSHQRISNTCSNKSSVIDRRKKSKQKRLISEAASKSIAKGENICPNCSAQFSTPWGLRTHLRSSTICSDDVPTMMKRALESKRSVEESPFSCSKCEQKFARLTQLREHVELEESCLPNDEFHTVNRFTCPRCSKSFKFPSSLERHFVDHAPTSDVWICQKCHLKFDTESVLRHHFHQEHFGEWFCIMCNNTSPLVMSTFKEFYSHIFGQHASEQSCNETYFKCMTCYRSFLSKSSLDLHVKVNTCRKMFEQVYNCISCSKSFTKKTHISNHMKYAHFGFDIDPRFTFRCPKCPRKFRSEEDYWSNHLREGCANEEQACDMCDETYIGTENLITHIKLSHKQKRVKNKDLRSFRSAKQRPAPSHLEPPTTPPPNSPQESLYIEDVDISAIKMEPSSPCRPASPLS